MLSKCILKRYLSTKAYVPPVMCVHRSCTSYLLKRSEVSELTAASKSAYLIVRYLSYFWFCLNVRKNSKAESTSVNAT